jgi:FAD-dependent urate hydroxylase
LSRAFESSVPGLFFVGLLAAPTFGPVMRFMYGAKHVAPVLAQRFAAAAGAPVPLSIGAVVSEQ